LQWIQGAPTNKNGVDPANISRVLDEHLRRSMPEDPGRLRDPIRGIQCTDFYTYFLHPQSVDGIKIKIDVH